MPVRVEKHGGGFVIVETATGHVKGHSTSRKAAAASARIRNAAHALKLQGKKLHLRGH